MEIFSNVTFLVWTISMSGAKNPGLSSNMTRQPFHIAPYWNQQKKNKKQKPSVLLHMGSNKGLTLNLM